MGDSGNEPSRRENRSKNRDWIKIHLWQTRPNQKTPKPDPAGGYAHDGNERS
jgi:hypothetical protein